MHLTREAIGPKGSNCFSRGVHTSISKEICDSPGGPDLLSPPLDPPMSCKLWAEIQQNKLNNWGECKNLLNLHQICAS